MDITNIGRKIIEGGSLEDKLIPFKISDVAIRPNYDGCYALEKFPARDPSIKFDSKQVKFPKKGSLHLSEKRAMALHSFANHELMAIEMMASALLIFPTKTQKDIDFKQGLLKTIQDEQKHFLLYQKRINELGLQFGDLPLNDFFWRYMDKIKGPEEFYSVVALTFEAANLDFAKYYKKIFEDVDDFETAKIMEIVYLDEISHVARGHKWISSQKGNKDIWEYFNSLLPNNLTPDRSKGIEFDIEGRRKAGFDEGLINKIIGYESSFLVTNRKEWKK